MDRGKGGVKMYFLKSTKTQNKTVPIRDLREAKTTKKKLEKAFNTVWDIYHRRKDGIEIRIPTEE